MIMIAYKEFTIILVQFISISLQMNSNASSLLSNISHINSNINHNSLDNGTFDQTVAKTNRSTFSLTVARSALINDSVDFNIESLFNDDSNGNEDLVQKAFIEFSFQVQDFLAFNPKTTMIELNAQLKYKWWTPDDAPNDSSQLFRTSQIDTKIDEDLFSKYYPIIETIDKNVNFKVKNQIYQMDNVETLTERPSKIQTLESKNFFSERLIKLNTKSQTKQYERHFSYLEQNVSINFNCKKSQENDVSLDFMQFPFDTHQCTLEFEIIPSLYKLLKPEDSILIYEFPSEVGNRYINLDNFDYFKLVQSISTQSLMPKEWILKRIQMKYKNSTSNYLQEEKKSKPKLSRSQYFNDLIKLLSKENNIEKRDSAQQANDLNYNPARITIEFFISRRREPLFYLFLLPLIIFTMITFLIFFIPTTETSEKSLVALINFAFILAYNIFVFKLVVVTYELIQIPLILKYSNCLMIIQLSVLAYTCLAKSIYLNGFLTLNTKISDLDESSVLFQQQTKCYPRLNQCKNYTITKTPHEGDSVKIQMPVIKIQHDLTEDFVKCLVGQTGSTEESNYTVYNHIDSSHDGNSQTITSTRQDDFVDEHGVSVHAKSNYGFVSDGYMKPSTNQVKSPSFLQRLFCCWFLRHSKLVQLQQKSFSTNTYQNNTIKESYKCLGSTEADGKSRQSKLVYKNNLEKLIKFEEIKLKDKLLKEEWRRKARYCDGICCLFVFFILATCTITIFAILPSFKVTSLMD